MRKNTKNTIITVPSTKDYNIIWLMVVLYTTNDYENLKYAIYKGNQKLLIRIPMAKKSTAKWQIHCLRYVHC